MTRSTLRSTSAAAVAVLALGALVACGDDDGGGDDTSSSAESGSSASESADAEESEASEESESASASEDSQEGADEEDSGDDITANEFMDVYLDAMDRATTASLTMTFGGSDSIEGTGEADFTTSPPSMHLVIGDESTDQNQEMIIVDGIMYLGLSPKRFIEYDLSDPNSPLGTDLTDQLDPSAMAEVFEKGITKASYLGEEDVDGESMEHYRVTLDSSALIDEKDLPSGAPTDALGDELTFDLWFDDDGNFRRQEASLGESGGGVELSYDNWGEPVDIKAPPKSQITKIPNGG